MIAVVIFQTSVQQSMLTAVTCFIPVHLRQDHNFTLVVADGAHFYSGCGDKAIAAAKAKRGGEAPFRSKL